jgi:acetolactate synthase-1/3 small subunit
VSPSSIKGIHKFTITSYSDRETIEKLVKQVEKRIGVLKSFFYTDDEIIYQEIALYKVPTSKLIEDPNLEKIIRKYNARILEMSKDYTILEKTGHPEETESLFEDLKRHDIRQFVRSGRVAVTKDINEYVTMFIEERKQQKEALL